jgi:tRNA(Arg) A34 adenosine deaminase TadA
MNKDDYYINQLQEQCQYHFKHTILNKHIAGVVYKKEMVSTGVNKRKTHPFQALYGSNTHSIYWHAETSAIHGAMYRLNLVQFWKCSLYVIRINNIGQLRYSKPCQGCMRAIKVFNIKRVVYSTNEGYKIL